MLESTKTIILVTLPIYPIIQEELAFVDCQVVEVLRGGDHDFFIGKIITGYVSDGQPLIFHDGKYVKLAEQD